MFPRSSLGGNLFLLLYSSKHRTDRTAVRIAPSAIRIAIRIYVSLYVSLATVQKTPKRIAIRNTFRYTARLAKSGPSCIPHADSCPSAVRLAESCPTAVRPANGCRATRDPFPERSDSNPYIRIADGALRRFSARSEIPTFPPRFLGVGKIQKYVTAYF